jgi:hypothetical protein
MNETTIKKNARAKQNNNKSGIKAKRRELRRMEAIARQITNVQKAEENAKKAKNKVKAESKVIHAQMTLQQIRGGTPHDEIVSRFSTPK